MKTACLLAFAWAASGQNAPAFEVASIKPAPPLSPGTFRFGPPHLGARISKTQADFGGMSLEGLIAYAYRVKTYQISGPDFLKTERFDILAKLPEEAQTEQVPEMLQALLAERFKLALRRESKEFPVYALVVAKGGPKLTPKPADYNAAAQKELYPVTMETYASLIGGGLDRPVVNLTELTGQYLISMQSMMSGMMDRARARSEQQAAAGAGRGPGEAASDPDGATFAMVQTLGLKLEPRKLDLPYLIVDRVEKAPTDN